MPVDLWLVEDVARFLKVSKSWVYRAVARKAMPAHRIGGGLRFVPQEIEAWVLSSGAH